MVRMKDEFESRSWLGETSMLKIISFFLFKGNLIQFFKRKTWAHFMSKGENFIFFFFGIENEKFLLSFDNFSFRRKTIILCIIKNFCGND